MVSPCGRSQRSSVVCERHYFRRKINPEASISRKAVKNQRIRLCNSDSVVCCFRGSSRPRTHCFRDRPGHRRVCRLRCGLRCQPEEELAPRHEPRTKTQKINKPPLPKRKQRLEFFAASTTNNTLCWEQEKRKRKLNAWSTAGHDVPCADQPSYAQRHERHE